MADIDQIDQIADPAERAREIGRRLGELPKWQERLRAARQVAVQELRAKGFSYAQIGEQLDLHRNRVQQIAEGRTAGGQGGGGPHPLPTGITTTKDNGKTVYQFSVVGPTDTADQVLRNAGGGFWHDLGQPIVVNSRSRPTAIRVYELCLAAGCQIAGREES